ncbi:unnamed protein product [Linum tenue]|uniref:Uncharacterized protein n=1 Tax=Linum tenue TaxID=586396 RepID=A0AAV0NR21_9ROSI|nr:unnamed protein product [Linum tenue]
MKGLYSTCVILLPIELDKVFSFLCFSDLLSGFSCLAGKFFRPGNFFPSTVSSSCFLEPETLEGYRATAGSLIFNLTGFLLLRVSGFSFRGENPTLAVWCIELLALLACRFAERKEHSIGAEQGQ